MLDEAIGQVDFNISLQDFEFYRAKAINGPVE